MRCHSEARSPNLYNRTSSNDDWKAKYDEVCETLAETEADLAEFQVSSKELEEEMGIELERSEKAKEEMKMKLGKVENEREDWKVRLAGTSVAVACS